MPILHPNDMPDLPELVGKMAGEYRLKHKLGEGGFGAVYAAEHPVLKRRAAVKVLHKAAAANSDAVLRFISEAQVVNQIQSPHIIDIFSFGRLADGRHFYVMDLLDGEPLDSFLRRERTLDVVSMIQLLGPIAEALDAAHAAGIVHRDLKPQNIFLAWQSDGHAVPKLLDFGLAKLLDDSPIHTASGTPMGTPLYMSPEQARGDKVDRRADVYALGVLCHELLTGEPPINGDSAVMVLLAHLTQSPMPASEVNRELPVELDDPILRMLAKDPEARTASVGEALESLRQAAMRAGLAIPPGTPKLRRPDVLEHDTGSMGGLSHATTEEDVIPAKEGSHRVGLARTTAGRLDRPGFTLSLGVLMLFVCGGAAISMVRYRTRSTTTRTYAASATPTPASSAPVTPAATGVACATEVPEEALGGTVELRILGAPMKAQLSLDGRVLGEAPGPVSIPRGTTRIQLNVSAPGYESGTITIVPQQDTSARVHLTKRTVVGAANHRAIPKDLENPF